MAVAILSIMLVVMLWSVLCIRNWPELPVEPGTVAAAMYYLYDSRMLEEFDGIFQQQESSEPLTETAFRKKVEEIGVKYQYGEIEVSGRLRLAVERVAKSEYGDGYE